MGLDMLEVFSARGASLHQLNALAEWVRLNVANIKDGKFDVIRFVEIDLPNLFPGLYVEIENDNLMGRKKAYLSADPLGIVVAESIYNRAADGCLNAAETILHEVGHLFLHERYKTLGLNDAFGKYKQQFKDMSATNSAEWQAKTFAVCVMFPYSIFMKYKSRLELQVYFDLSVEQSDRVLEHIKKLRMREAERRQQSERRWIESVVGSLPREARGGHVSHAKAGRVTAAGKL